MTVSNFRFGVLTSKLNAEIHELPLPEIGDGEVLVKQLACNICTADYTVWLGERESSTHYPMSGGHESAGIVEAVGKNVTILKPGDFVALANNYCGKCSMCRDGRTSACLIRRSWDEHGDYFGRMGFADYFVRPDTALIKMNPELSAAEAGFLEPVATVVKGMKKIDIKPMDKVVVIGGGTMGQLNARIAKAYGAKVLLSEIMDNKLKVAKDAGIETMNPKSSDPVQTVKEWSGGEGADAVIVAVGSTKANIQASEILKKFDGRLLLFAASYPSPEVGLTANDIHYRRLSVVGTYLADLNEFLEAAYLLNSKTIDVSGLIEPKRFKLDDIQEAFKEASTPGKFRVSLMLNE